MDKVYRMRKVQKHKPSILSRKRRRALKGTGSNSAANVRQNAKWDVMCAIHGAARVSEKNPAAKWVRVGEPKNKRQRQSGCPRCAASRREMG